jgi:hypothetical protein
MRPSNLDPSRGDRDLKARRQFGAPRRAPDPTDRRYGKTSVGTQQPAADKLAMSDPTGPSRGELPVAPRTTSAPRHPSGRDYRPPPEYGVGLTIGGPLPAQRDPNRPTGCIGPYADVIVHSAGRPAGHVIGHGIHEPLPAPRDPNRPAGRIGPYADASSHSPVEG